jgi:hypothetical protein
MLGEYSLVHEYNGFGVYRALHPWDHPFLILPGGSGSPGVRCHSLEEAQRLIDEFISQPESELARALGSRHQLEHCRRERREQTRENVCVFLHRLLRPAQAAPASVEDAIKSWIAEIGRQLRELNFEDSDDYFLAVERARRGEPAGPARELAEARLALLLLLCDLEVDCRLEERLRAVLTDRKAALALAKQFDLEP